MANSANQDSIIVKNSDGNIYFLKQNGDKQDLGGKMMPGKLGKYYTKLRNKKQSNIFVFESERDGLKDQFYVVFWFDTETEMEEIRLRIIFEDDTGITNFKLRVVYDDSFGAWFWFDEDPDDDIVLSAGTEWTGNGIIKGLEVWEEKTLDRYEIKIDYIIMQS